MKMSSAVFQISYTVGCEDEVKLVLKEPKQTSKSGLTGRLDLLTPTLTSGGSLRVGDDVKRRTRTDTLFRSDRRSDGRRAERSSTDENTSNDDTADEARDWLITSNTDICFSHSLRTPTPYPVLQAAWLSSDWCLCVQRADKRTIYRIPTNSTSLLCKNNLRRDLEKIGLPEAIVCSPPLMRVDCQSCQTTHIESPENTLCQYRRCTNIDESPTGSLLTTADRRKKSPVNYVAQVLVQVFCEHACVFVLVDSSHCLAMTEYSYEQLLPVPYREAASHGAWRILVPRRDWASHGNTLDIGELGRSKVSERVKNTALLLEHKSDELIITRLPNVKKENPMAISAPSNLLAVCCSSYITLYSLSNQKALKTAWLQHLHSQLRFSPSAHVLLAFGSDHVTLYDQSLEVLADLECQRLTDADWVSDYQLYVTASGKSFVFNIQTR